jgi:hypothetical protein
MYLDQLLMTDVFSYEKTWLCVHCTCVYYVITTARHCGKGLKKVIQDPWRGAAAAVKLSPATVPSGTTWSLAAAVAEMWARTQARSHRPRKKASRRPMQIFWGVSINLTCKEELLSGWLTYAGAADLVYCTESAPYRSHLRSLLGKVDCGPDRCFSFLLSVNFYRSIIKLNKKYLSLNVQKQKVCIY